jgi:hypothetical protein
VTVRPPPRERRNKNVAEAVVEVDSAKSPMERFKAVAQRVVTVPLDDVKDRGRLLEDRKKENR